MLQIKSIDFTVTKRCNLSNGEMIGRNFNETRLLYLLFTHFHRIFDEIKIEFDIIW